MPEILAGGAVLIGVLGILVLFTQASPRTLARGVRYGGVVALALAAAGLMYARFFVFGLFVASLAWGLYWNGHFWPTGNFFFTPFGFAFRGQGWQPRRPRPNTGNVSQVRTAWIEMSLDHDTGEMQGTVLQGAHAGQPLGSLGTEQVLAFYGEAGVADAETARLLEAYLDRRFGPDWRLKRQESARAEEKARPGTRRDSGMSREEAYRVLGLSAGASAEEIHAAHRRLMMQNHPDRGGSSYIAAKINEAKDVLLG